MPSLQLSSFNNFNDINTAQKPDIILLNKKTQRDGNEAKESSVKNNRCKIFSIKKIKDREKEAAVLASLIEAQNRLTSPKESKWMPWAKIGLEVAGVLFTGLGVLAKFYDVKARTDVNIACMHMEEIDNKYVNPKYINLKSTLK